MKKKQILYLIMSYIFVFVLGMYSVIVSYNIPLYKPQTTVDIYPFFARPFYTYNGTAMIDKNYIIVRIPARNDTGQMIYTNTTLSYGIFEWDARYLGNITSGFEIVGLFNLNQSKYVIFSYSSVTDRFSAINSNPEFTETIIENINFQNWNHYKIVWKPDEVSYYINYSLIATHTTNIPKEPLYFGLQCGVPPEQEPPQTRLKIEIRDFNYLKL